MIFALEREWFCVLLYKRVGHPVAVLHVDLVGETQNGQNDGNKKSAHYRQKTHHNTMPEAAMKKQASPESCALSESQERIPELNKQNSPMIVG